MTQRAWSSCMSSPFSWRAAALCWILLCITSRNNSPAFPSLSLITASVLLTIMFFLSCCILNHQQGKVHYDLLLPILLNDWHLLLSLVEETVYMLYVKPHYCCIYISIYDSDLFHAISPAGILLTWRETTWPRFWSVMSSAVTRLPSTLPPAYMRCAQRSVTAGFNLVSLGIQDRVLAHNSHEFLIWTSHIFIPFLYNCR